ncbi:hypothetical protein DFH07DRAFT_969385 [Mycena maculata]|uniref:Uncharacterized protein n=1 Tax=Mycena maculata TaxID=230809 RepID=A0AAD7HY12_9AGAR|nr:hypothetical protein DFH07DRAFT_969385 [Mycena maculata]
MASSPHTPNPTSTPPWVPLTTSSLAPTTTTGTDIMQRQQVAFPRAVGGGAGVGALLTPSMDGLSPFVGNQAYFFCMKGVVHGVLPFHVHAHSDFKQLFKMIFPHEVPGPIYISTFVSVAPSNANESLVPANGNENATLTTLSQSPVALRAAHCLRQAHHLRHIPPPSETPTPGPRLPTHSSFFRLWGSASPGSINSPRALCRDLDSPAHSRPSSLLTSLER